MNQNNEPSRDYRPGECKDTHERRNNCSTRQDTKPTTARTMGQVLDWTMATCSKQRSSHSDLARSTWLIRIRNAGEAAACSTWCLPETSKDEKDKTNRYSLAKTQQDATRARAACGPRE